MTSKHPLHKSSLVLLCLSLCAVGQVPQIINYQGRINVAAAAYTGVGQFRFALVNGDGTTSHWSNDGTSTAGAAPAAAVSLPVANGLYVVPLGDPAIPNMQALPPSVFTHDDVRLRVWFDDGIHGNQMLAPDQRITSVAYAMVAGSVPDGTITTPKLDPSIQVPGAMIWQEVAGGIQQAAPGRGYVATSPEEVTVTLPQAASIGDVVRISGGGTGGWRVEQKAGQSVRGSGFPTGIGETWVAGAAPRPLDKMACSATGQRLLGVNGSQLYTSDDSGSTWATRIAISGGPGGVACSADGRFMVSAHGGGVHTSINGGVDWVARGLGGLAGVACSNNGLKLVAVGSGIFTSIDSGVTWVQRSSVTGFRSVASSADGTRLVAVVYGGQIHTSNDSGETWTARETSRTWYDVASSADGTKLVAIVYNSSNIFTSSDAGVTWTARSTAATGGLLGNEVACSADGSYIFATRFSYPTVVSGDFGVTWKAFGPSTCFGVACSADGTQAMLCGYNSLIGNYYYVYRSVADYDLETSTTEGAAGYLRGGQGTAVELQHLGAGRWLRLSGNGAIFAK